MRISDWSSDVCSSDLATFLSQDPHRLKGRKLGAFAGFLKRCAREHDLLWGRLDGAERLIALVVTAAASAAGVDKDRRAALQRSEEHTSELQSLMRISYAVFCLKKKKSPKSQTEMTFTTT